MSILVTGATGGVGALVVRGLVEAGLRVRATARDPGRVRLPPTVDVFAGDLREPRSLEPALRGATGVFLYAQTESLTELMATMQRAGVEQVVVLSTIDADNDRPYAQHNRRRHRAVEAAAAEAGFRHTFLRPGAFASNARRFWAEAIARGDVVRLPFPESAQAPIDDHDIAAVAVRAFAARDLDTQALVLTGPESLTQRRQVEIIGAALGRTLRVERCSPGEARAALAPRVSPAYVDLLLAQWEDEEHMPARVTDTVEQVTGRRATDYRTWAARNAGAFAPSVS